MLFGKPLVSKQYLVLFVCSVTQGRMGIASAKPLAISDCVCVSVEIKGSPSPIYERSYFPKLVFQRQMSRPCIHFKLHSPQPYVLLRTYVCTYEMPALEGLDKSALCKYSGFSF